MIAGDLGTMRSNAADVIIGGGFAGLAAGAALSYAGRRVTLVERRATLGGRAYSFTDRITGDAIDNGQHLMMGCYHETLAFLDRIGASGKLRFQSRPRVDFLDDSGNRSSFNCPQLPAPLHLAAGLAGLRSVGWRDRLSALRVGLALRPGNGNRSGLADITATQWLTSLGQSENLQRNFWNPLALATLNETPDRASADMLVRVIEEGFLRTYRDSLMVVPRVGLSELYTHDAQRFIEARGGSIRVNTEVADIIIENNRAIAVGLKSGERIDAANVISTAPPPALRRMLRRDVIERYEALRNLSRFEFSPIVSINLWYDEQVMEQEFACLLGGRIEWVFNRNAIAGRSAAEKQHLALVASGAHSIADRPREDLIEMATAEMLRFFPAARRARLHHAHVVREREATISHTTGVARLRPQQQTEIDNFYLAGDWTATGLPATIEGAVRSGNACAGSILAGKNTK